MLSYINAIYMKLKQLESNRETHLLAHSSANSLFSESLFHLQLLVRSRAVAVHLNLLCSNAVFEHS